MNQSSTLLDFIFVIVFTYFMLLQPGQSALQQENTSDALSNTKNNTKIYSTLQVSPLQFDKQKRGITKNQIVYPFKQVANKMQRINHVTKEKYFELRSGMNFALGFHEEGRMFQSKADQQAEQYNTLFNAANKRRQDLINQKKTKRKP